MKGSEQEEWVCEEKPVRGDVPSFFSLLFPDFDDQKAPNEKSNANMSKSGQSPESMQRMSQCPPGIIVCLSSLNQY